jgi:chromosome segregation ATPase
LSDKASKLRSKGTQNLTKDEKTALKSMEKRIDKLKELRGAEEKRLETSKKNHNELKKQIKTEGKSNTALKKLGGVLKDGAEEYKKSGEAAKDYGRSMAELEESSEGLGEKAKDLGDGMDGAANGAQHWSTTASTMLSATAQLGMGIQMLTSGFTSLGEAIASGEASWQDYLGAMTSILMSMPMILSSSMQLGEQIGKIV